MVTGAEVNPSTTVRVQPGAATVAVGGSAARERADVLVPKRPLLRRPLLMVLPLLAGVVVVASLAWFVKVSSTDPMTKQAPASFFTRPTSTGDAATPQG